MPIPTYQQFISPLLQFLNQDKNPHRAKDVHEGVAQLARLSEEDKSQMVPSNTQAVYKNRITWAQDAAKRYKLTSSPLRGFWQITEDGSKLIEEHKGQLSDDISKKIATGKRSTPMKIIQSNNQLPAIQTDSSPEELIDSGLSPEELIDSGLNNIKSSVIENLIERISDISPLDFEKLVLDVLHAMGYGLDESDVKHTGQANDGGIDGIISLDKLGLENIYVQAKRWKNSVGSTEVQTFMGALQLKNANKGVLISSGPITKNAYDLSKQAQGNLVLIDGVKLASLMIEHGIGVQHRIIKIPKIDEDYFE